MGLSALVKGALAIDFTVTTGNLQQPVGEYSFQSKWRSQESHQPVKQHLESHTNVFQKSAVSQYL